jgi:anti-sigma factor RsiW
MNQNCFHLSDEDLLLAADGELSKRRRAQVHAHLGACWACRARMAEVEETIHQVVRLSRETFDPELPQSDGARARLEAKLADAARSSGPHLYEQLAAGLNHKGLAYALALMILLALGTRSLYHKIGKYEGYGRHHSYAAALPNPVLTPGATLPVPLAGMCSSEHDQVVRKVPEGVQQQILREYGIAGGQAADFEIDQLVTPGLGGSDDIRNLWPEPRYRTVWNSYVKDQLEDHLHYLVCNGQVNLATAQHDIANDWISAYRKYFHTNTPLLPYSTSGALSVLIKDSTGVDSTPWDSTSGAPARR